MRMNLLRAASLALVVLTLGVATAAHAIDLNPVRSGWFRNSGASASASNGNPTNQNYISGNVAGGQARNFFVFDLSGVSGTVTGATLFLYNPQSVDGGPGYVSSDSTETYQLTDTTSSTTALQGLYTAGDTTGQAIYGTLGTGTVYGSHVGSVADNGTTIALDLSAALSGINSQVGSQIGFGGRITTLTGGNEQYLFGFSDPGDSTPPVVLRLTTGTVVPEAGTLALVLPALGAVFCVAKSRLGTGIVLRKRQ